MLVSAEAAQWKKKRKKKKKKKKKKNNNNGNKSNNNTDKSNNSTEIPSRMLKSYQYFEVTSRAGHFKHLSTWLSQMALHTHKVNKI